MKVKYEDAAQLVQRSKTSWGLSEEVATSVEAVGEAPAQGKKSALASRMANAVRDALRKADDPNSPAPPCAPKP